MCSCLLVVPSHGGLDCKFVHQFLPLRLNILQKAQLRKETIWLSFLVKDLGITIDMPTLHCDNQSAIMLAKSPMFHAKTKHITMKYHFIEEKSMDLVKVHATKNPTNIFTKGFPRKRFVHCCEFMGIG